MIMNKAENPVRGVLYRFLIRLLDETDANIRSHREDQRRNRRREKVGVGIIIYYFSVLSKTTIFVESEGQIIVSCVAVLLQIF